MRIRNFREEHIPNAVQVQRDSAQTDGTAMVNEDDFVSWLTDPVVDATSNAFVITDDDDELNTWGQAGTLEGLEGDVVGYTILQLHKDQTGYHFLCQGAVHPDYRRQNAGRLLLVSAMNRARLLAAEFEFEAEEEGLVIYFEALLPVSDPASAHLAEKCELLPADEPSLKGLCLYRRELS